MGQDPQIKTKLSNLKMINIPHTFKISKNWPVERAKVEIKVQGLKDR